MSSARAIGARPALGAGASCATGRPREVATFNGYWILEIASQQETVEWASRAPLGPGTKLEVRRITDASDFPEDNEWIQKEQGWIEDAKRREQD